MGRLVPNQRHIPGLRDMAPKGQWHGSSIGAHPDLMQDTNGSFYDTTSQGYNFDCLEPYACGGIYSLSMNQATVRSSATTGKIVVTAPSGLSRATSNLRCSSNAAARPIPIGGIPQPDNAGVQSRVSQALSARSFKGVTFGQKDAVFGARREEP
jgi:hypothetical protein